MTRAHYFVLTLALAFCTGISSAQVPTGTPPFGSFGGGPDIIDLANLNSRIAIPVLHKPGRGINFDFDLTYDTSVWYPVGSSGSQSWHPVTNLGWSGSEIKIGRVNSSVYEIGPFFCGTHMSRWTYQYTWSYIDGWNAVHRFPGYTQVIINQCTGNSTTSMTSTASDGSGYTISATGSSVTKLTSSTGDIIQSGFSIQDRNGNEITTSGGTLTDTLGVVALTISGTAPNPVSYSYTAPSGASAAYTVKYTAYTVQTKFGCSGIAEYGPTSSNLVSEIDLPDGSKYSFTYEGTPGVSGNVTGRLASVTLPTGGTISYSYTGGSNGITCADGSAATVTRTTPDGTWTYAQVKGTGAASTTTVTDPPGNQTVIQFQGIYETQRQVYQGSTSGTLLLTTNTCYNGSASPCNGTAVVSVTQRSVITTLPNNLQSKHVDSYNAYGVPTETDDYDYGSGAPGALLRKTTITYASLGNITAFRQQVTVYNGAGTVVSQTNYNYDETAVTATSGTPQHVAVSGSRGNLTSINYPVSGLASHFTYYDTGTMNTATDVNGAVTTNSYAGSSCGNSFPTSVSEPLSLSRSMTWNCTGGVQLTATDENGKTVTTTYNDAYFWRPNAVADQLGNQATSWYQPNPTYCCPSGVGWFLTFNNGNSQASDVQYEDGLGRVYTDQHVQSPGSTTLDTVSYTFDANGRPYSVSVPCAVGATGTCSTKTTQTYDALNRPLQTTDGGGGTTTYSYAQNDVLVTIGPAPSSENTKRRQLEYDELGRLTSVCEITNASGSGACGQNVAQIGFWTRYSYDALNNFVGVTQNAQGSSQTRSYTYDAMSRLTSETNPESGTKTYVYDSDSTMCGNGAYTSSGDLVKTVDAAGNCVMRYYDSLHRVTDIGNSNQALNHCQRFRYDNSSGYPGSTKPAGLSNTFGRLIEAATDVCWNTDAIITDEWFSYTPRGEISDVYASTPNSGGYYHANQTYWASGVANQLSGLPGLPAFTYAPDGEGRPYQVSASSGQNPVTSTAFNPASLPTAITYGSADSDGFTYDPNTNRMTQYQFTVNGSSLTGVLGWNANGTLSTQNITDAFNSADTQNCAYQHDDVTRLASANCGSAAAQTFSFDAFGNINKSGSPYSFQPTYSSATNRMTSIGSFTPTYDANGNVTNDSLHTYTWNADGRPITIDSVNLTYDALGRMVEQNRSGAYTQIVYAPTGQKFAVTNGQTLQKAFLPLPSGGLAVYNSSGLLYYGHSDHLGSLRFASTPSRTMYFDLAHAPFGEVYASSGSTDPAFTSQRQDTVSGLYDFPAREYSIQGRWPSPDPAGLAAVDPTNPQSWNRYAYVMNNPMNSVDPLGLNDCPDLKMGCMPSNECLSGAWCGGFGADLFGGRNFWNGTPYVGLGGGGGQFDIVHLAFTPNSTGCLDLGSDCLGSPPVYDNWSLLFLLNSGGNSGREGDASHPGILSALGSCTASHFGLTAAAGGTAALGAPISKTALDLPTGMAGASDTMSLSSAIEWKLFGSAGPKMGIRVMGTTRLFGAAGRLAPYVSAATSVVDARLIGACMDQKLGLIPDSTGSHN